VGITPKFSSNLTRNLDKFVRDRKDLTKEQKDLLKAFDRGYMIRWKSSNYEDTNANLLANVLRFRSLNYNVD